MVKYREILRLTAMGISQRNVAFSVGCAASTVQDVLRAAKAAGLEWPLPEEMDDAAIRSRIYPTRDRSDHGKAEIDHAWVDREMQRPGVTMTLLWNEYVDAAVSQGRQPYMYSAFCHRHRKWAESNPEATMHIEWRAGEWTQVDWCGDTMRVLDLDTGELLKVWVFVASLPFSAYVYAEGFYRMDEQAWVTGHVRAFNSFGGTTPLVAPDNLKTGIIKNTMDELIVNEQYRRMLEHYGAAAVPTRVRKPRDKGGVEGAVLIVERQAIAALRNRTFTSLEELNRALRQKVAEINGRPFQKREGSRESVLLGQERACLRPLPPVPYEMVTRKRATVQYNYHVSFDHRYYSAPARLVRREVEVVATASTVQILCDGERVAQHVRSYAARGSYVTDESHMPESHRDYSGWSGEWFRRKAGAVGPETLAVAELILKSRQVEQQSYRTCRALIGLGERNGNDVLEEACAKARAISPRPTYKTVRTLVSQLAAQRDADPDEHAYLRGADYYRHLDGEDVM